MIDKGTCDNGFICNSSNCECECDKLCDIGQCSEKEYSWNIDEKEMIQNDYINVCNSCTIIHCIICHCFFNNYWH